MGRKLLRHMSADLDPCRDEGGRGESATMRAKTTRMTQPADWRRVCLVLVGESRRIILADPFWSQEVACWPIGRHWAASCPSEGSQYAWTSALMSMGA
jgi:hypothetical protein